MVAALRTETETAAGMERPGGRGRLACLETDGILALDLPPCVGYKPFHPKNVPVSFFGLTESRVNLSRAETHWQDTNYCKKHFPAE